MSSLDNEKRRAMEKARSDWFRQNFSAAYRNAPRLSAAFEAGYWAGDSFKSAVVPLELPDPACMCPLCVSERGRI